MNESIKKVADKVANFGFRAIVPDLYRGKVAKSNEDAGHLMGGLDWGKAVADIASAAQYLKSQGCKKVGVVGFCMGGALVIASSANVKEIDAGICFYGAPDLSKLPIDNIKIPLQAHFGDLDDAKEFSDPSAANNLETTLKNAGVDITLYRYANAGHAFTNRDRKSAFNEEAANLAWERAVAFFKQHLVSSSL